jgi:hypothetical protein
VESSARTSSGAVARPRAGEVLAGAAGVLLLIALLLPWYGRETDIAGAVITESWTAWQTLPLITVVLFAIAALAIAVPVARALGLVPAGFRGDRLLVVLGGLGLALVLFRLVDMPIPDLALQEGDRADASRGPGPFLALLATVGIVYGARLANPR